jgi:hypothetical protein
MDGGVLTPYRRKSLYDAALTMGAEDVDGGVDGAHVLTHALAQTSDGPLEVREDFMDQDTVPERDWTSAEVVAGAIDFYGIPETDPEAS